MRAHRLLPTSGPTAATTRTGASRTAGSRSSWRAREGARLSGGRWSDRSLAELHRTSQRLAPQQLEFRANALTLLGRNEEALRTYAAARAHNLHTGVPWPSQNGTAQLLERARAAVPARRADAAWSDGATLTVDDFTTHTSPSVGQKAVTLRTSR